MAELTKKTEFLDVEELRKKFQITTGGISMLVRKLAGVEQCWV